MFFQTVLKSKLASANFAIDLVSESDAQLWGFDPVGKSD